MRKFPTVLLSLTLLGLPASTQAVDPPASQLATQQLSDMKAARKKIAEKPRRVLYNDDGNDERPYKTPEELIGLRVKQVANTQVDTIFYCTGGGGLFWGHQAKVGETLGEYVNESSGAGVYAMRDGLEALKALGTDPLATVIDYGHKNNMEVIWSYRMNNPEDSYVDWGLAKRKRQHPSYLMGKKSDWNENNMLDPKIWWALEDFSKSEVRDFIVDIFEDVCQRYDIDGIELDFIRHPLFFRPNMKGDPATPSQVAQMTDMVRKIRVVTEREALKRGRPILVVIRAPLSVKAGLDIGLDVPTYLKEGLMDILIAGQDYVQMGMASDLKDMVDLGHKYGVPVYGLLVPPKPYNVYNDIRAWRGAAMNRWYWGADGIYIFNFFPQDRDARFSEFGSVDTLKGLGKIYGIDNPIAESILGTFKVPLVAPDRLPLSLSSSANTTAKLTVGEDIVANAPPGQKASALLRIQAAGMEKGQAIEATFNGQSVGPLVEQGMGYELNIDPKLVKPGYNNIDLKLNRGPKNKVTVDFLDLVVDYQ